MISFLLSSRQTLPYHIQHQMRPEQKFQTLEDLVDQIRKDGEKVRKILGKS